MIKSINELLLSNSGEITQTIKIDNQTIILTIEDEFKLGKLTDADLIDFKNSQDPNAKLFIFAKNIFLGKEFPFNGGGITANELNLVDDSNSFIISGDAGETPLSTNLDPEKPKGDKGGDGKNGGSIKFFFESISAIDKLEIIAKGGKGGNGQAGSLEIGNGGDGGDGGNGGIINLIYVDEFLQFIPDLVDTYKSTSYYNKKDYLTNFLSVINNNDKLKEIWSFADQALAQLAEDKKVFDAKSKTTGSSTDIKISPIVNQLIDRIIGELKALGTLNSTKIKESIDTIGGDHGWGGIGKTNGNDGSDGKEGNKNVVQLAKIMDLVNTIYQPFYFVHPSQLQMLLEKAKLLYFTLDAKDAQSIKNTYSLLTNIRDRTSVFKNLDKSSDLYQTYDTNELSFGCSNSVNQLISIYSTADKLIQQLGLGLDFFGYQANYVPLISYQEYKRILDELLASFVTVEKNYTQFYIDIKNNKQNIDTLNIMKGEVSSIITNTTSDITALMDKLKQEVANIDYYQSVIPDRKKAVVDEMNKLADAIANHFDFNIDNFFASLSMIAFAPESQLMRISELSKGLYQGLTKVTDDEGVPVNKAYLLQSLQQVQASINSLSEGYLEGKNGMIEELDVNANMLLTQENEFFSMMNKFYGGFTSEMDKMKILFESYVDAVTKRNNHIVNYNAILILILKKKNIIQQANETNNTLNDKALEQLEQKSIQGLFAYVSHIYYSLRFFIMEVLMLTDKALSFCSLSYNSSIKDEFAANNLSSINYNLLLNLKDNILDKYLNAMNDLGIGANHFPREGHDDDKGIEMILDNDAIESLKFTNKILLTVPVADLNADAKTNVFADRVNIRLTKVMVWVKGAKTDNNRLYIDITHTGPEKIVDKYGKIYNFIHDAKSTSFEFNLNNLADNSGGEIYYESLIDDKKSALVGPFADSWIIEIRPRANQGLDLNQISEVKVEFHGTSYTAVA